MKKRIIYIITGTFILVFVYSIFSFCGYFLPVYEYKNNTIIVDKIPYGFENPIYWHPKGDNALKIGRINGYDSDFPVFLYKFKDNDFFVIVQPMVSCMVPAPMHRQDIAFPSFSADIINRVELKFNGDMIRENKAFSLAQSKTVIITDKNSIALLANCLSNPVKCDKIQYLKPFGFSAESDRYQGIFYAMETTVYNGHYCFIEGDGIVHEIPLLLLEQISGLDLFSPEEYLNNIQYKWEEGK
jgi:hypothetical protein